MSDAASKKLNQKQQEAVEYIRGPLLIVAGAGTGKTTVITNKIEYLVNKGLAKPEEILALTFTDRAAEEMEDRVGQLLEIGYVDLQISTFHAFCERLLEQYGIQIGIPNQFKLLTDTDAWLLVRRHIYDFNLEYYRPLGNPARHIHEFLKHFSKCKDELISPSDYLQYAESVKLDHDEVNKDERSRLTEVANAYHAYNQLLLDNNALDFGDIIYYTVKLLRERTLILKKLQERFKYILVDEFQDVNYAQYELVRQLTINNEQLTKNQLTVVGDDDQSIYAFRGASVSNILRFKEDYPKAQEIVLTENYRSGQKILDAAYTLIQKNNPDRLEVKLGIDKRLQTSDSRLQSRVERLHYSTLDDEVRAVVDEINRLKKADKNAAWDDFAILVRANSHATPFIQGLERAGIPYEYLASSGLYRQGVVLDAINFFRALEDIKESEALYRLLRLPPLALSVNDLQLFTSTAKKKTISYYEALKIATTLGLSPEGVKVCEKLISLMHDGLKRTRTERPTTVLHHFFGESGYFDYLTREVEAGNRSAMRSIYHIQQFFDYINHFEEAHPGADVATFIEHFLYVVESGDTGKMEQEGDTPDSVNIMTVHGAKGLEFTYVFVVNLVEDRFPARSRGEAIEIPDELVKEQLPEGDAHIEEERRLLYVGMTRAKEGLYLTSADDYGGSRKKKLSRFLDELGYSTKMSDVSQPPPTPPYLRRGAQVDEQETAFVYTLPTKFSFSQIQEYDSCPYLYKLKYILKIPEKGNAYFSFGNTMHLTLQRFYQRVQELNASQQTSLFGLPQEIKRRDGIKAPSFEELLKLYEGSWQPDWFESQRQREEYHKKGKELLKVFYEANKDAWTIPVALEEYFQIKVGEYTVHGKIDRVDKRTDGTLEIIDYKTGKSKEKLIGSDKDQLLIYQMAAENLPVYRNIGKVGELTYYYLNDNMRTSFMGDSDDVAKITKKIVDILNRLHVEDWNALTRESHSCRECEDILV